MCDDLADALINRFEAYPIVRTPLPGGVEVARGTDEGDNSEIAGRDPGVAVIYATARPIADLISYYQVRYPNYHLRRDRDMRSATDELRVAGRAEDPTGQTVGS